MKVHNNASDIIYIFLWKNDTNEALFLGSILPHEEDSFIGPEGQRYLITSSPEFIDRNVLFEYIKIPFEESLIITNSPESSFYKMEIESSFNDYLEFISSLLSYCGYLNKHGDIVDQVTAEMVSCLSEGTFTEIDRLLSQRLLLLGMRDTMAPSLRNYTCGDDRLQTSKPIEISEESIHDGQYQVQTLFQMDSAQIFLVPNFLTVNECEALVETSRPRLERAAVVGENGAAVYSESRRAQQAAYTLSGPTDPLW